MLVFSTPLVNWRLSNLLTGWPPFPPPFPVWISKGVFAQFMYLRRSLWLFRNPPWFHKSCVFFYYIPLQWGRRPMGAVGWAADEGPLSSWPMGRRGWAEGEGPLSSWPMGRRGWAEGEGPLSSWPLSPHFTPHPHLLSHLTLIYCILLISPPPPIHRYLYKKPEEMKVGGGGWFQSPSFWAQEGL